MKKNRTFREGLRSFLFPKRKPRYRLYDTWEPRLADEFALTAASFHDDASFHEAFGDGRVLPKHVLTGHFTEMAMNRRYNPLRHAVTVRRDRELTALLAGGVQCGSACVDEIVEAVSSGAITHELRHVDEDSTHASRLAACLSEHEAEQDERLEARFRAYNDQLHRDETSDDPIHYSIQVVAVAPGEQGRGHVRAMLERLIANLETMKIVEFVRVSTYDRSKVALYEHLGFDVVSHIDGGDTEAWVLQLPLGDRKPAADGDTASDHGEQARPFPDNACTVPCALDPGEGTDAEQVGTMSGDVERRRWRHEPDKRTKRRLSHEALRGATDRPVDETAAATENPAP